MAKEIILTYESSRLVNQKSSDYSNVEQFNEQCLPLLKELGIFKERDINAYTYLSNGCNANYDAFYAAYLAKCLGEAESEAARELIRVKFPEMWKEFCSTHFFPHFPVVRGSEFVHYDESAGKFALDFDAYKTTEDLTAESAAELATVAKLRALDKALAALDFSGVSVRGLFAPDSEGKISTIAHLNPAVFSALVESNK